MSEIKLNADDPRLTAFALGELEGKEAKLVAAAVEADLELQAAVEEARALAGSLEDAFASEALPVAAGVDLSAEAMYPLDSRKIARFPYYWVSGVLAASFAVMVLLNDPESPVAGTMEVFQYEMELGPNSAPTLAQVPLGDPRDLTESELAEGLTIAEISLPPSGLREQSVDSAEVVSGLRVASDGGGASAAAVNMDDLNRENNELIAVGRALVVKAGEASDLLVERLDALGPHPQDSDGVVHLPPVTVELQSQGEAGYGAAGGGEEVVVLSAFSVAANPSDAGYVAPGNSPTVTQLMRKETRSRSVRPPAVAPMMMMAKSEPDLNLATEGYAPIEEQDWQRVADHPLSTFAADVDSASYANVRRFLNQGQLPPSDAVRVEELINAFDYNYAAPAGGDAPFAAHLEVGAAPWAPEHRLVRVGLKGRVFEAGERAAANLVFLLDVSGSMNQPNKLPLVKEAMRLLVGKLRSDDRVAIVTYAGSSGLALPSTAADQRRVIFGALDELRPGGSTNGSRGIELAYDIAKANFVEGGINRVILCTDGDFNVGMTSEGDLGRLIMEKAKSQVFLTALGFGMGNYQDRTLEQLANKGNGNYGYIDSAREARRLLVEQVEGTLATIAKDVKIQVEFNPLQVAAYRLIGYENRHLAKEDFNDDQKDGGEIGAGHAVTALYEIVPFGMDMAEVRAEVDALRYQTGGNGGVRADLSHELLTVKVRAKAPDGDMSRGWAFTLVDSDATFAATSADFKFASAVAGFGMILRDSTFRGSSTFARVLSWAEDGLADDPSGYRSEFVDLVRKADALMRL